MSERNDGCHALREIAGQGEAALPAYIRRREAAEKRRDAGTMTAEEWEVLRKIKIELMRSNGPSHILCRVDSERRIYSEPDGPVTLDSPVAALERFGFNDRMQCWCDKQRIYTVRELRLVLRGELWRDRGGVELATAWRMGRAYSRAMIFGR